MSDSVDDAAPSGSDDELKAMLAAHERWRASDGSDGRRAGR